MATLTLTNVPDSVLEDIRRSAELHARTVDDEALARLSRVDGDPEPEASPETAVEREAKLMDRLARHRARLAAEGFTVNMDEVIAIIRRRRDAKP